MKTEYKKLDLCKNNDLFKPVYPRKRILKNIGDIKVKVISIFERAKFGVSRYDSWDFDHYLLTVLENGLKFLKDAGNSYPGWCSYEEWQNKLSYIIKLCEIANLYEDEVTTDSFNKYIEYEEKYGVESDEAENAKEEWIQDTFEFEELKVKASDKALNEIQKYLHDLWD